MSRESTFTYVHGFTFDKHMPWFYILKVNFPGQFLPYILGNFSGQNNWNWSECKQNSARKIWLYFQLTICKVLSEHNFDIEMTLIVFWPFLFTLCARLKRLQILKKALAQLNITYEQGKYVYLCTRFISMPWFYVLKVNFPGQFLPYITPSFLVE